MRKEYDFSKGVRGKFYGKTRIVGPVSTNKDSDDLAGRIVKAVEADIKKHDVWRMLDRKERAELRQAWRKNIDQVLAG